MAMTAVVKAVTATTAVRPASPTCVEVVDGVTVETPVGAAMVVAPVTAFAVAAVDMLAARVVAPKVVCTVVKVAALA